MSEFTKKELIALQEMANEDEPWADAVQAYLDALVEVEGLELPEPNSREQKETEQVEEKNTGKIESSSGGLEWDV